VQPVWRGGEGCRIEKGSVCPAIVMVAISWSYYLMPGLGGRAITQRATTTSSSGGVRGPVVAVMQEGKVRGISPVAGHATPWADPN
jgi:hypothetical protein